MKYKSLADKTTFPYFCKNLQMRKIVLYVSLILTVSIFAASCGKETSDTLLSFNAEDVELNGNTYNLGCLECDLFTWCDNSQYTYVSYILGAVQPAITYKYKNVSRRTVGGFEFTGTLVKPGDTVYHNCQNNVTRILSKNKVDIFKIVNGDGIEGETWSDTYSNGDSVINYKIVNVDAPIAVLGKTYSSNVIVQEKKYFTNGSSLPSDWTFIEENENVYARDRISSVRIGGVGLIQKTTRNTLGQIVFQNLLKSYILP